ncbi:unnamed protein product, partial [marine sediment metagenome]
KMVLELLIGMSYLFLRISNTKDMLFVLSR